MTPAVGLPDARPARAPRWTLAAGGLVLVAAVAFIYRDAARSYFFDDDFQWLQAARDFALPNLFRFERYTHFYRPLAEVYFFVGRGLFGCNALPFHVTSIVIHLVNTALLFLFARTLTADDRFAGVSALVFAVHSGHAEAASWVCAVGELLAFFWYVLALWTHLLFLRGGRAPLYAASLLAFTACLLTHETSATLLPMMVALEATVLFERRERLRAAGLLRRAVRYLPFVLLLAAYLVLAYVVNSRSYLIREGHYRLGWHVVRNAVNYLVTLYIGRRDPVSQVFVVAVAALLLVRGTPRVRFFTVWVLVTIVPVSLFAWGGSPRYLYLPAAGFAMLLASGALALRALAARYSSERAARVAAIAVVTVLCVRFAVFAQKVPAGLLASTRPYERYVAAVREQMSATPAATIISLDPAELVRIQEIYRDPAAEVATCGKDVHVVAR